MTSSTLQIQNPQTTPGKTLPWIPADRIPAPVPDDDDSLPQNLNALLSLEHHDRQGNEICSVWTSKVILGMEKKKQCDD